MTAVTRPNGSIQLKACCFISTACTCATLMLRIHACRFNTHLLRRRSRRDRRIRTATGFTTHTMWDKVWPMDTDRRDWHKHLGQRMFSSWSLSYNAPSTSRSRSELPPQQIGGLVTVGGNRTQRTGWTQPTPLTAQPGSALSCREAENRLPPR